MLQSRDDSLFIEIRNSLSVWFADSMCFASHRFLQFVRRHLSRVFRDAVASEEP